MDAEKRRRLHLKAVAVVGGAYGNDSFGRAELALIEERTAVDSLPVRSRRWCENLHTYEDFWAEHGRAPRERTRMMESLPADERHLGEWANRQRRHREALGPFREARLGVSPAFTWDPWQARWDTNFDAVVLLYRREGRFPAERSADTAETRAATWWKRQTRALKGGALRAERAARVATLLRESGEAAASKRAAMKTSH